LPIDYEWDNNPFKDEEPVRGAIKRVAALGKGIDKDLWSMSKACHEQTHYPMVFIRNEKSGELYYICKQCFSKYCTEHPGNTKNLTVLRGTLTTAALEALDKYEREHSRKKEIEPNKHAGKDDYYGDDPDEKENDP
jgi:hypothetical protein